MIIYIYIHIQIIVKTIYLPIFVLLSTFQPHIHQAQHAPCAIHHRFILVQDYASDPNLASQLAVWVAQTTDTGTPTRDVQVKNLVAMLPGSKLDHEDGTGRPRRDFFSEC